jgi:hypothetical protein
MQHCLKGCDEAFYQQATLKPANAKNGPAEANAQEQGSSPPLLACLSAFVVASQLNGSLLQP